MIVEEKVRDVKVNGFKTSQFQVAIDRQAVENIINPYSCGVTASLRELCTNALDSMREAGKLDVPFEVQLPTTLNPILKVSDSGTGISHEDMSELYSVVNKSSKRQNADATGFYGIGKLALLSICNQFTVTSRHGGKKRTYVVHQDEKGIPCLSYLESATVDCQDSGFEVTANIKSSDIQKFRDVAKKVLIHFPTKPTLNLDIDFSRKVIISGDFYNVLEHTSTGYYQDPPKSVIMGSIAYPIDRYQAGCPSYSFELEVPVGSVSITSSRESLQYDEKTKIALRKYIADMQEDIGLKIEPLIDKEDCEWNRKLKSYEFYRSFGTSVRRLPFEDKTKTLNYRVFTTAYDKSSVPTKKIWDGTSGVTFVLDDLKIGAIARSKELSEKRGDVVLIQECEKTALKEFGLLKKHLVKASSLDKPPKKSRKNSGDVFELQRYERTFVSYAWKKATSTVPDALYIEISRWKSTLNKREITPTDLNTLLDWFSLYETIPKIYGIKKGVDPEKTWTSLEEWMNRIVAKHGQKYSDETNGEYIDERTYDELSKFFDLGDTRRGRARYDKYSSLLKPYVKLPEPTKTKFDYELLRNELFFYPNFRGCLDDARHKEAFILLCKKYCSFPLKKGV